VGRCKAHLWAGVDKQEDGKAQIESKGKTITRNATPDNPAYTIEGARNPVLKKGSELEKVGEGEDGGEEEPEDEPEAEDIGEDTETPSSGPMQTRAQSRKAAS